MRDRNVAVDNNFAQGLVTEAPALTFPPNAVIDALNCVFEEQGNVIRRPPIDYENTYTEEAIDRTASVISTYVWKNVSGDGGVTLYVQQVGETLYFYKSVGGVVSPGQLASNIDLTDFSPAAAPSPKLNECAFATGLGYLFVTHPNLEPFYVSYDIDAETVTGTEITVQIRDLVGLDDGDDIDERPNTLEDEHNYNLRNQGWYTTSRITSFEAAAGDYPSNADVWWAFKNIDNEFDVLMIPHVERGSTRAPQGHYVLNAFNQDRSTASGIAGFSVVTTSYQRPSVAAFFAGRLFYAGVNYPGWESKILFSQIIEDISQAGFCYWRNDPTSQDINSVDVSDGGYFTIPGSGTIHNVVPIGQYLLVFAANGVWSVTGSGSEVGFTALSFKIDQISLVGSLSRYSFVDVRGLPMFWTTEGVCAATFTKEGGVIVQNVSNPRIRSFFLDIPVQSKLYARGAFDPLNSIAIWLYKSEEAGSLDEIYEFDRMLTLNLVTGAFSPWSIDDTTFKLHGTFTTGAFRSSNSEGVVTDNALDDVTANDTTDVTVLQTVTSNDEIKFKFVISRDSSGDKFSFAEQNDSRQDYQDFGAFTATAYSSYFIPGYRVKTQGVRPFQSHYLYVFTDTSEEDTDCYVSAQWDFSNSNSGKRWSTPQRILKTTGGQYTISRNKLLMRGQGVSVQFKYQSQPNKGFNIQGWSTYDTANQSI